MTKDSLIYVAGHKGLVGSAILRELHQRGHTRVLSADHYDLNLEYEEAVGAFFSSYKPEYVFLCAALVGGIQQNNECPVQFLTRNLRIQDEVLSAAFCTKVKKLLFLGSSCMYPRLAPQPIPESALLTGILEPTNEPYALAKIAGVKLVQAYRRQYQCDFISAIPCNVYGPGDRSTHVIPMLVERFKKAVETGERTVTCWGTGAPQREFIHADDLARACVLLMNEYSDDQPINVGSYENVSIWTLAEMIAEAVGFKGDFIWDDTKPDGTPRKLLDSTRIRALGWGPRITLREGLRTL